MFVRIGLVGMLIAVIPFGVFGQTPNAPPTQAESLKVLRQDLSLSDEQFGRVKELVQERREQLQTIRQEAKPAFEELVRLLREPNPDPEAVNQAANAFSEIHERAVTEQESSTKAFLKVLNPDQQQTISTLQSKAPLAVALDQLGLLTKEHETEAPKVIVQ